MAECRQTVLRIETQLIDIFERQSVPPGRPAPLREQVEPLGVVDALFEEFEGLEALPRTMAEAAGLGLLERRLPALALRRVAGVDEVAAAVLRVLQRRSEPDCGEA